ncbi:proton-conducting transporter membrane subunit [Pseudonocardia sp. N23]|uniref:proton-conducting transporter transmembrane domain-containing protein n=1 Tax=Pseudonocardia sp. N23 TaxID=1987376 RepID=UPI000BFD732C|nr:proton-conducting transporter membrane subunit [Pseudonocardia sp. N23]GAY13034.1 NADH-ubiquinone oxidoreductase chain L [Pseudonocardia sp. N23]
MLLWWLIAVPLMAGALLIAGGRRVDPLAPGLGVGVSAVVLALAVATVLTRPVTDAALFAGIRAGFAVDGLSAVLVLTVAGVLVAVLVFAAGEAPLRTGRFTGLMLVFAAAMLAAVTATGLAPLLMAWEVMGAASWALIGYHYRDPAAVRGAHTAFLTTRTADLGLYLAAGAALAGGVGALSFDDLPAAGGGWRELLAAGVVVAALGKSAQLPFSFWLSGAMRGPSPVSALLHSATMVAAGAYLLLRLTPLLGSVGWAGPLVAWVGAATALGLGLVAVAQRDLKQLLAASTCAQLGYMILAAGVGGTGAGVLQLVAHAATKSLLFLAAGAWLSALGTKQLGRLDGAARRFPFVGVVFTVGALSLAGLPPLSLSVAKDTVLAAALAAPGPDAVALYAVGLAGAAVAAVYSTKALWFVWQPPHRHPAQVATGAVAQRSGPAWPADDEPHVGLEQAPTGQVPTVSGPPLVLLAIGAATLGVLPLLGSGILRPEPAPHWWELVISAVVAAAAAGWGWRAAARLPAAGLLARWFDLERAAHVLIVVPVLGAAMALARFDDRVLDGGVDATARATLTAARLLDRRGEPAVDGLVRGVAEGARALGRWARRPQTGQLHQYYAQASVGFGVLAVLAVVVLVVS